MSQVLKRATVVVAIGAVVFLAFDRYGPWQSGRGWRPRPIETLTPGGVDLRRAIDGHFHVSGTINGQPIVFLVDTGASTVAIGDAMSQQLALRDCRPRTYATAGGAVRGCEARADEVTVAGVRFRDVRVAVLPDQPDGLALLGMNVLGNFRIETEGSTMRLRARSDS